jgi:2',3'-cyclic-nucleotide 2'-phosphodiesterase (5'-nucleotidase family)
MPLPSAGRWSPGFLLWLAPLCILPTLAGAACGPGERLTLLHFNDFHGQLEPYTSPEGRVGVGGIARLAATVAAVRAEDPARPAILLFGGDLLQGTLTSSLFLGVPDVALFDRMGVDAAAMGNHELDYGQDVFRRLAQEADFPILNANVHSDPVPLPVKPYVLLERPTGLKIAVLGLSTTELTTATHPRNIYGISVEEPITVARRMVPELRAGSDLMVVLSHMGIAYDRRLAQSVPGIDLIVGGHNHNLSAEPILEGNTAIVQAGERGAWLGRMDLECRDEHLTRTGYALMPIDDTSPQDLEMAAEVRRIAKEADRELGEVVGQSAVELSAWRELIRRQEAPFGDFLADLAREITQTDLALFNAGTFRSSIPAGPVTLKQIHQAFPFRNELVVGTATGAQVLAALERSASLNPMDNPGGFLQVSGVRYAIDGGRLASATIGGEPIDPARRYRVATSDFLAEGGDAYAMLVGMQDKVASGRLISDMVIDAFRNGGPVEPRMDGRIERY